MSDWRTDIEEGRRFEFGKNWTRFVSKVDEARVQSAQDALSKSLGRASLVGSSFLDAGCGSGIHSLAARRLGASVVSFDYDLQSIEATRLLKERFAPDDDEWSIERGSVLDSHFMESLGEFDVVYSWGVLHHTGDMWGAMRQVERAVGEGGELFLALYNDQGLPSRAWTAIKRRYVEGGQLTKSVLLLGAGAYFEGRSTLGRIARGEPLLPFEQWQRRKDDRGMSVWTDLVDWVGGYPFEVSKPEEVFEFFRERGFELQHMITCAGGLGCNEFVFRRRASTSDVAPGANARA